MFGGSDIREIIPEMMEYWDANILVKEEECFWSIPLNSVNGNIWQEFVKHLEREWEDGPKEISKFLTDNGVNNVTITLKAGPISRTIVAYQFGYCILCVSQNLISKVCDGYCLLDELLYYLRLDKESWKDVQISIKEQHCDSAFLERVKEFIF